MSPTSATRPAAAAEDRLSALLNAAVDAIILISPAGLISRFNSAAERLFGYDSGEVLGRNVSLLMPEPYRAEHDGYLHRYLGTGDPRIIGIGREVVARRKDGSTFPIDLSVGEFRSGDEHGFVGILRDISARKEQEEQLRRGSEEMRLIFENAPTAILISDLSGHTLTVNRSCSALLGYTREELMRVRHSELFHPDDREDGLRELVQLREGGDSLSSERKYVRKDGVILHALHYSAVVRDSSGKPMMMIAEIVDRSAVFEATREAEELRGRLTHVARLGTLGEMVSGIAHEVNQPLTAIATYASACRRLLASGQSQPEDLSSTLEKISTQAERAGQVIRGLRNLLRKRESVREPLDLNQLVREVARLTDFELKQSGFRLVQTLAPQLPQVIGDGVQIQQVVLNLIRNGLDAMAETAHDDYIEIATAAPEPGWAEVRVTDCGPGIDPATAERLYEPFFTTKVQGIGLGLSICKSIVSAHAGAMAFASNVNGGTTCSIRLPVRESGSDP